MTLPTTPQLKVVSAAPDQLGPAPLQKRIEPRRIDSYSTHPAVGLTVEMLLGFYREAESGLPVRQFDCFEDLIEIDGHLRGHINGRIESVSGCDMVIKPGRSDKPSEIAAAALNERIGELQFREFVEHQLEAPHFGIAGSQLVWDAIEGVIAPVDFINVAHRRFASPSPARAAEVWLIDGDSSKDLRPLEPGLWAISRYRGRNPWSAGLMRTAAWWAMIKRWSVRDWQVFAEMFGLPLAVGFYEPGASLPTRQALEETVKVIGQDGYAVLESTCELVLKESARSGDSTTVFPKIIELCEAQISKLIAGATLTTDVGGTGSYALGAVHESRAYALARSDARRIEGMFQRDIGLPFKIWNGYDRAAAPHLSIKITRDSLERAKALAVIGQVIDLDEDQLREEFSLRVPAAGKGVRFTAAQAAKAGTSEGV